MIVNFNGKTYSQDNNNVFSEASNSGFDFSPHEVESARQVYNLAPDKKIGGIKTLRTVFHLDLLRAKILWEFGKFVAEGGIPNNE